MADSGAVAAAGSRREGRERLLGLLYEAEVKGQTMAEVIEALPLPLKGYAGQLAPALSTGVGEIDARIEDASHHWKLARMPAVDRALLRMATFELAERPDIPPGAIISEAVELAAEYSTDASSKFVNGVLARLAAELRPGVEIPDLGFDIDD